MDNLEKTLRAESRHDLVDGNFEARAEDLKNFCWHNRGGGPGPEPLHCPKSIVGSIGTLSKSRTFLARTPFFRVELPPDYSKSLACLILPSWERTVLKNVRIMQENV